MARAKESSKATQTVTTAPAQEPEVNEVDGEPIYHADEEEGEDHE